MNRFACEFVRDGGIGKIRAVECVNFKGPIPYPAEGLPAEPIPNGVDWDLWQGQAPERPFNRKLFSHWTDGVGNWWGNWRDYSNSQLTGLGSHAFDMVQYALGMDETGPVELWPIEEGPTARLRFRYANGVEVRLTFPDETPYRGPRNGAIFVGEDCKIEINRNKFTTNPPDFIKNRPGPQVGREMGRRRLGRQGARGELVRLHPHAPEAERRRRNRPPHRVALPTAGHHAATGPPPEMGSRQGDLPRRRRSQRVARPAATQGLGVAQCFVKRRRVACYDETFPHKNAEQSAGQPRGAFHFHFQVPESGTYRPPSNLH